jgi:hypothetical protein
VTAKAIPFHQVQTPSGCMRSCVRERPRDNARVLPACTVGPRTIRRESLHSGDDEYINFKCGECWQTIAINGEGLKSPGHATCLNCLLTYSPRDRTKSHLSSRKSRGSSVTNVTKTFICRRPSLKTATSFSAATVELLSKDGLFSLSSKQTSNAPES